MPIQYVTYKDIDKVKWDKCITEADNSLIYSYSFYLDAMAKNWDALVLEDYKTVMPLTWNKKYGFHYLYQPFFCASLGVFGTHITAELVNDFLNAIPSKFKLWDIYLNYKNHVALQNFKLYQRKNFVLDLNNSYTELYNNFRENTKRNIKKSTGLNCIIKNDISLNDIISLAKFQSKTFSPVTNEDFKRFDLLYQFLLKKDSAATYGAFLNKELVASAVFFFSNNRAYYILVGNHPNGKTIGASHALINAFIKDHAEKNILLDFEGSDISSLAFFYSSFGATEENYTGIKLNKLPFWIKWFKK